MPIRAASLIFTKAGTANGDIKNGEISCSGGVTMTANVRLLGNGGEERLFVDARVSRFPQGGAAPAAGKSARPKPLQTGDRTAFGTALPAPMSACGQCRRNNNVCGHDPTGRGRRHGRYSITRLPGIRAVTTRENLETHHHPGGSPASAGNEAQTESIGQYPRLRCCRPMRRAWVSSRVVRARPCALSAERVAHNVGNYARSAETASEVLTTWPPVCGGIAKPPNKFMELC